MGARDLLGAADIGDAQLLSLIAAHLGLDVDVLTLEDSTATLVDYDVDAIFTAGRWWVSGTVLTPAGAREFRFFVKHVQAWSRSPIFQQVPPEIREFAALIPWCAEVEVYRSGLSHRLPSGLRMPRAYAVVDLDQESAVLWLEAVPGSPGRWDADGLAGIARLLGRLAASRDVADDPGVGRTMGRYGPRDYLGGRLAHMVIPTVLGDDVWHHPLVAATFDTDLRDRMRAAARAASVVVDELDLVPVGNAHGDACNNNLLVPPVPSTRASRDVPGTRGSRDVPGAPGSPDVVLVDYGFWGPQPLGFDLGQLLVGELQLGRRTAAELAALEPVVLDAYVEGLREEGCDVDAEVVRRAHALQMLLYFALSAIPFELLGGGPTPEAVTVATERADAARFVLDLVDATAAGRRA